MITLNSGIDIDFYNFSASKVDIESAASSLSKQCRFLGHCDSFYSTATHCNIGTKWFMRKGKFFEAYCFNMHEIEEVLVGDCPTGLKYSNPLKGYRRLAKNLQNDLLLHFGIFEELPKSVKDLDNRMALAEARTLFKNVPAWAINDTDTSDLIIKSQTFEKARKEFLELHYKLKDKLNI